MIKEKHIQTTKTARYYTLGNPSKSIKKVWFIFHGHGQLASEFLKDFEIITDDKTLIVAPEAMNKFYVRGFSGKIGTTWMTKQDRENEINDYVNMIEGIYQEISETVDLNKVKINILAFSQGGHTASRWLAQKQHSVTKLILWGSGLPRDIIYKSNISYWNRINIKLAIGRSDNFITKERLDEELDFLDSNDLVYELITYDGGHSIDVKTLMNLCK